MNKTLRVILLCLALVAGAWVLGTFFGSLFKTGSWVKAFDRTFTFESLSKVVIPLKILAAVIIAIFLQIIFHETGHLVFGLISGYKFYSFSALGLILVKEPEGMKLERFSMPGAGGQCLMVPPQCDGSKVPVAAYNAGGIVFNLILSIVALVLILFARSSSVFVNALELTTIVVGVYLVLVNGIPMHVSGMPNDGYNMLHLERNPRSREAFATVLRINQLASTGGVRPREIPSDYFAWMDEVDFSESVQVNLLIMYITHLIDDGKLDQARQYCQKILDSGTKVYIFKLVAKYELISIRLLQGEKIEVDDKGDCTDKGLEFDKRDKSALQALELSSSAVKRYRFLWAWFVENDPQKAQTIYKEVVDNPQKFIVRCEWEMDSEIMRRVLSEFGNKPQTPSE